MSKTLPADFAAKRVNVFRNLPDGEQELVRAFFGQRQNGYYVDLGANEPVFNSQTYHLEQLGWQGLMIEPIPAYCDRLKQERTGLVAQYACSAPENSGQKLKLLMAGGHSTLNEAPIALGTRTEDYIEVECRTLDEILEKYGVPRGFDFISIDIEGHEMEMFKGFSLGLWKPGFVLLEDHVTNLDKHRHMVVNGYQLIMRTGLNSWYVPAESGYTLSLNARLQYFRKYYLGLLPRKFKYRHAPV